MSIELPKDAEGREIPLDTEVLYSASGESVKPYSFTFRRYDGFYWEMHIVGAPNLVYDPASFHLIPPNSWENLLVDLDRASGNDCDTADPRCAYFNRGKKCRECSIGADSKKCGNRGEFVFADIASRIRKLRGEDR